MLAVSSLPSLEALVGGQALFAPDLPVWCGKFGDDVWPLLPLSDPLHMGKTASAIMWSDFIHGHGSTHGHHNSGKNARYVNCLTQQIVDDLKVAAVIHGYFPALVKASRRTKKQLDPKTVKGRIEELVHIFSATIIAAKKKYGKVVTRLQDVDFALLKECIKDHPGRGAHLKRALKLLSSPMVQRNLSAPLQWQLVDIEKSSIAWPESKEGEGIQPLPDLYFLRIQNYAINAIGRFKSAVGLPVHCSEYVALAADALDDESGVAIHAFLTGNPQGSADRAKFDLRFKIRTHQLENLIADVQCASIMMLLLFTGMRRSEIVHVRNEALSFERGYWFIKSKVVKHRKKDTPTTEGWLAIDIVRDAFEVLAFFCQFTGSESLMSSPFARFARTSRGYSLQAISLKLSRWLGTIHIDDKFKDWVFSIHQCRETLVYQLASQQVKLPFVSMQLKHFHSRFHGMPNEVTAGYGNYRAQLMTSVSTRLAQASESALNDLYDENAKFAGGGGVAHKMRVDAFFAGMALFGADRVKYIKAMANRGVKLQPTSIGNCTKNFELPIEDKRPPCYGDYECDPDCGSHVITERGGIALNARRTHALAQAQAEGNAEFKVVWLGLADKLGRHAGKLVEKDA
jgi:integrase